MLGKKVYFIEENRVITGIITDVCENKKGKKYVAIFFDVEGAVQERILRDNKFSDDVFGFSFEEFIKNVEKRAKDAEDALEYLKKEFEKL
jgi:hypothetical protein